VVRRGFPVGQKTTEIKKVVTFYVYPGGVVATNRVGDEIILKGENITLSFGGITALMDVNFSVKKGEVFSIIGPNGAGKSSMYNVINGFYHPQHGKVIFKGKEITHLKPFQIARLGIARSFQNIELFKNMTVLENMMLGRHIHIKYGLFASMLYFGPGRREEVKHRKRVEDVIDFLEIEHIRKKHVGTLPYGLQKRVEMARALCLEPEILLLDEPMAGMNLEETEDMCRFIVDVNTEWGVTVLLIEHDMGVVMDLSDRMMVLDFGESIAEGTPEEIQQNEQVSKAYLGDSDGVFLGR
jgi:branched-chain amino acid transport system ATP-binding protein